MLYYSQVAFFLILLFFQNDPFYFSEVSKMSSRRTKAEIEAINTNGLDMLEKRIIHKILHKAYH